MWRAKQEVVLPSTGSENFNYTIVSPANIRANRDYKFNLTIHDSKTNFNEAVVVRASIVDDSNKVIIHRNFAMNPNVTEFVSMPVGDLPIGRGYKFVIKGVLGTNMEHQAKLHLQTQRRIIFIQTDKALYKPNDCIRFRVLVLDLDLKAAVVENNELKINIFDSRRNLLKKWNGVNTTSGVFSGEYQLSDQPNLGLWKIEARIHDQMKESTIEVAEKVLPKFEISIDSPGVFMLEDKKAHVIVSAKYTHGKPLKGTVGIRVGVFEKTVAINGQVTIELDMLKDLKFNPKNVHECYKVDATVTENLTGLSQSCSTKINVDDTYIIRTNPDNYAKFERGSNAEIIISVRKQNGLVPNFDDRYKRKIIVIREQFFDEKKRSTKTTADHQLNKNGDVVVSLDIAKDESSFSLQVDYVSQKTDLGIYSTVSKGISVTNTNRIENNLTDELRLESKDLKKMHYVNKPIEMELISHYPISSYTYVIVARGKILESKSVKPIFDDSFSSVYVHRFSFIPNYEYAPKAKVIVYCVKDGFVVSSSFTVHMYGDFRNFIDINVSHDVAKPGESVDINVTSSKNAFIGLLGIDKSSLILRSGNDLDCQEIWNALDRAGRIEDTGCSRFGYPGLNLFSNINPYPRVIPTLHCVLILRGGGEGGGAFPQYIRKNFPETWIWDTIDSKSFDGSMTLRKKVPDSLTTWILTGFAIDPVNGFALIKAPVKLSVQQEFYVSLNLPYSVKRGEIVTIPCAIFNHLSNNIEAKVTLDNESDDFDFVDTKGEKKPTVRKTQRATVPSNDAVNIDFVIRPKKIGLIPLKVSAVSSAASDYVIHNLNVECEGVPQFVNEAVFIDLREKSQTDSINFIVDVPKIALPDSKRIEVTCVGSILGGVIKNLQQLIRLPYGCGEQNMINFVPNIVVLNYLKNTDQLTDEIEAKAKKFMEIGYQRELHYMHYDGSFSTFGQNYYKSGSTWLTAFVARSFQQASEHIAIEYSIISKALTWLAEGQSQNGSFVEKGSIFDKEMQSGAANGLALTAYVLTAFLVNESSKTKYRTTIQRAIDHITKSVKNCSDVYALAVSAYALQLAGHKSKEAVLDRLQEMATRNREHKWWQKSTEINHYGQKVSKTLNVEITAYVLLTMLKCENGSDEMPVVKWLLNQRNSRGGFHGTQDTNIGIEALANFALKVKNSAVKIDVRTSSGDEYAFDVNKDNFLVLQSQKLEPDVTWVTVKSTGRGCSLLELAYRYNINAPDAHSAFLLKPHGVLLDDQMSLTIEVSYQLLASKDSVQQSNMVILEASLPSGFVLCTETLNGLKEKIALIKRTETKNNDTTAFIYFEHLTPQVINLKIIGSRKFMVTESKPAPVVVYDYYDNALSAREFYTLK